MENDETIVSYIDSTPKGGVHNDDGVVSYMWNSIDCVITVNIIIL